MNRKPAPRVFPRAILLVTLFIVISGRAQAQDTAAISGAVRADSGAVMPNAKVTVKNAATGESKETQTDAAGNFAVAELASGDYDVIVSAEGFTTRTLNVNVGPGPTQRLNVVLMSAAEGGEAPSLQDLGLSPAQTQGSAAMQARLDRRSHMLKMHQRLGLITTVPLLATVITGGFAGGRSTSSGTRDLHAALGTATAGLYITTAYYAIFAPRIPGTQTHGPIRLHKALAWVHGPGMILTPILGAMAFDQRSRGEKVHGIASAHGVVAVVTAAAYGAAILSVSIKF